MSDIDHEDIPTRKRRRLMQGPDGFDTKVVKASSSKVHVPRFTPAFEGQEQVAHKSALKPASIPKDERVLPRPQYNLTSTKQLAPMSKSKPLSVSKPTLKAGSGSKPTSKTVSLSKPASKGNHKQLEVPAAPFVKPEKPALGLRPLKPPISLDEWEGSTSAEPSLHRLPPPPIPPPETPSKPLKSLGPPPVPFKPFATPDKSMRTISTTHIALMNDLSTESGKAELASIFLHDQHPDILAHAEDSEDGNLNLGVSPQKMGRTSKGKGKEPKFVRNGLAARASMLFSQTHTALALWQKEIENVLSSSGSTSRRLTPDLRLRIIKVIDVPVGSGSRRSGNSTISPGLAICRVLSPASRHKHSSYSVPGKKENHLVVLSFPTTAPPRTNTLHVRNPEDFAEGREVYIWEPWQEVSLSSSSPATDASLAAEDAEHLNITAAPFPLLPSSLPLSPSPTQVKKEDISDIPLADTAFLCSRFLIMR